MYTTSYQETKKQAKEKRINNSNLEQNKNKNSPLNFMGILQHLTGYASPSIGLSKSVS